MGHNDLLSAYAAASMLGVTQPTIYSLVRSGRLRRAKPRTFLFTFDEVLKCRMERAAAKKARTSKRYIPPTVGETVEAALRGVVNQ